MVQSMSCWIFKRNFTILGLNDEHQTLDNFEYKTEDNFTIQRRKGVVFLIFFSVRTLDFPTSEVPSSLPLDFEGTVLTFLE